MTRAVSEVSRLGALSEATVTLAGVGIESARQDAEWLLASVLGLERFALYLDPGRELSPGETGRYRAPDAGDAINVLRGRYSFFLCSVMQ